MSKNVIFISEQLFKERTGASNQIDARQIVPLIKVAQDMHIQPALGSTLYQRLQIGIENNNLLPRETDLLDNYITEALIWFTMASLPMTIGFQLFAKGFLQKSAEETVTPDRADLELIEQKYTSIAEFYKTRLVRYLQENETLFPEYLNFTQAIDTITPDQNAYTCPIYLGNSSPTAEALQYTGGNGGSGGGGVITTGGILLPPQPIIEFTGNVGDGLKVYYIDNGFDFVTAQTPELFLFRHRGLHKKKTNGGRKKVPARFVHPCTIDAETKWAGWGFFSGKQWEFDANGNRYHHNTRKTEWSVPANFKPYQRLSLPDFNPYMFFAEKLPGGSPKYAGIDTNILSGGNYKISDSRKNQQINWTGKFKLLGVKNERAHDNFKKVVTYSFAFAIDNPEATPQNGLCPKIFGPMSEPFHVVWEVVGNQHTTNKVEFKKTIANRLARVARPKNFGNF